MQVTIKRKIGQNVLACTSGNMRNDMHKMTLFGPFSQLLSLSGLPEKGPIADEELQIEANAGILIQAGKVVSLGTFETLRTAYPLAEVQEIGREAVVIPGFVDAHTHCCFAGNRAMDFAARNAGKSYLEIAERGGGIWRTVLDTRKATSEALEKLTLQHVQNFLTEGITTIEIKSGYGLSVVEELKMLRTIRRVAEQTPSTVVSTCLAAHTLPRDFSGSHDAYLKVLEEELYPFIFSENLAQRIDIFVEKSAFPQKTAKKHLQKARQLGFAVCVHADQFTTGGSEVAIQVGAISADHLEASGTPEIAALARSNVVAVVLPGASMGLGEPFAPARALLDIGACVAIASDFNPGSAPMGQLLLQAAVLATYQKISTAEIFAGLTFRAAKALSLPSVGKLAIGYMADFQAYPTKDYREILYHQGRMKPFAVWKAGQIINTEKNVSKT